MTEAEAMRRALSLARQGWGRVHPNPMVGAVVLKDGLVRGEGFHAEYGREHAEALAIAAAGERARGATLVVTLEPCSHSGKQPPCTGAIVAAGISRVVMAARDPNPAAAGGAEVLRAAGLEVHTGLSECEGRRINAAFFHRFGNQTRPWVALKLAVSLDHRIADGQGRSQWISGPEARHFSHALRAGFDAVAVGGRTAATDDPRLTARGALVPRVPPTRVLFEGRTPLQPRLAALAPVHQTPAIVVTASGSAAATRDRLATTGATIIEADTTVDALAALRACGIESLLVEGGGRLAGSLLQAGAVDRYYMIQSPLWLGDTGVPATTGWDVPCLDRAERWSVVERRALGSDTLIVLDREPCSPAS